MFNMRWLEHVLSLFAFTPADEHVLSIFDMYLVFSRTPTARFSQSFADWIRRASARRVGDRGRRPLVSWKNSFCEASVARVMYFSLPAVGLPSSSFWPALTICCLGVQKLSSAPEL